MSYDDRNRASTEGQAGRSVGRAGAVAAQPVRIAPRPTEAPTGLSVGDFVGMIRRHVTLIVVLFILIAGSGILTALFMYFKFPTYDAEARIAVLPSITMAARGPAGSSAEVIPTILFDQYLLTQVRQISSPQVIQMALSDNLPSRIANDLTNNVQERTIADPENAAAATQRIEARTLRIREEMARVLGPGDPAVNLEDKLKVSNIFQTTLISVKLSGRDRKAIADIVNAVVDSYMLSYKVDRKAREARMLAGLNATRLQLVPRVDDAERALAAFKREAGLFIAQRGTDMTAQLRLFEDALTKADLDLVAAKILYEQIQQVPDDAATSADMELRMQSDYSLARLRDTKLELKRQQEQLSKNFEADHDVMKAINSQMAETDRQIEQRREELKQTLTAEQKQMAAAAYQTALQRYNDIKAKYDRAKQEALDMSANMLKYDTLQTQYQKLQEELSQLDKAINDARVSSEVTANSVAIQQAATVSLPGEKAGPNLMLYIPGSVLLGLLVGFGMAIMVELIDNRVRTPQQVLRYLHTPVLTNVPDRKEDREVRQAAMLPTAAAKAPQSLIAESFRQLRTALMYTGDAERKTLLVTSPQAGTGKTVVVTNLGITLASGGSRVLLIDANFRRATLHRVFDVPNAVGLSSVLARLNTLDEAIQATSVANLDVLACGPQPPSPADLLGSEAMQNLLTELCKRYDNVIIDGAPILVVTDAHVLSSMVDGVVLVLSSTETSRGVAGRARRMLLDFKAKLVGTVLNRVRARKGGYFREAYQSYYDYSGASKK